jgi:hypothetical protein
VVVFACEGAVECKVGIRGIRADHARKSCRENCRSDPDAKAGTEQKTNAITALMPPEQGVSGMLSGHEKP